MAATRARSATRATIVLVDLPPNRGTSTIQSEEPSFSAVNRAERSMTGGFGTDYSGTAVAIRVLRKATPKLDQANRAATGLGEPPETEPMGRSIEEGVM
jgi:hypothetical protein